MDLTRRRNGEPACTTGRSWNCVRVIKNAIHQFSTKHINVRENRIYGMFDESTWITFECYRFEARGVHKICCLISLKEL